MELANHARAASARKGAAVGFAAIAARAGDALAPHLPKLAPKLFRMQFDPNRGVQARDAPGSAPSGVPGGAPGCTSGGLPAWKSRLYRLFVRWRPWGRNPLYVACALAAWCVCVGALTLALVRLWCVRACAGGGRGHLGSFGSGPEKGSRCPLRRDCRRPHQGAPDRKRISTCLEENIHVPDLPTGRKPYLITRMFLIFSPPLQELGSRLYRNRESAAMALADALQGRRWSQVRLRAFVAFYPRSRDAFFPPRRCIFFYPDDASRSSALTLPQVKPHFSELWNMNFRVLDDINATVRTAAASLSRALVSVTVRLCDAEATAPGDAAECVAAALPLLLTLGVPSSAAEVRAVSVRTVAQLAEKASAEALSAHLPDVVAAMLEALAGLEDSRCTHQEFLGITPLCFARSRSSSAPPPSLLRDHSVSASLSARIRRI